MPVRGLVAAAVGLVAAAALVLLLALLPRDGLASHPVSSVPELLSEPAGVPGAGLVLAPDGLGPISFGQSEADVMAKLTELLGGPTEDAPQPCPSEDHMVRWVRWGNLTVTFPEGLFAGYLSGIYFPPDSPELIIKTVEGVGPRSTADELLAAYGARLAWLGQEESGLGAPVERFGIDGFDVARPAPTGLGGLVEGGREAGRAITFLAGQLCGPASS